MKQSPNHLQKTELRKCKHWNHRYDHCDFGDFCPCSISGKITGKEKIKIHIPENADLNTRVGAKAFADLMKSKGVTVEIVTH